MPLSTDQNKPEIPVWVVVVSQYDYDDENYYQNDGYTIDKIFEAEEDARQYARQQNIYELTHSSSLQRFCDYHDTLDANLIEKVRKAFNLQSLSQDELIDLEFIEDEYLTEEQATIIHDLLDFGDFSVISEKLQLRQGEAVHKQHHDRNATPRAAGS